ncbi:MAG: Holliday junction resolvase RuvX [Candidatus Omnitrophica bacterium]|nr:Holliday junction resolvase RuvX [Candidatus Omnitrophota bacterium]MBU4487635.1 Holliday junction resolvase RuvX [Candidatus Omnitrophota bacterium]MCG2705032.1 Holliday junction resolvase RuvX [Candidatus Omnitrophota bacterium]
MRILSLDVGEKRIGMALSDALGIIAQQLDTLTRKNEESDFRLIKNILKEKEVAEIVVGFPLNMDGTAGPKAEEINRFVEKLRRQCDIPVKLWDERLTTRQADRLLREADVSRRKRKKLDDKLAAQLILQSYMDSVTANKDRDNV